MAAKAHPIGKENMIIQYMVPKPYISAGAPSTSIADIKDITIDKDVGITDIDLKC